MLKHFKKIDSKGMSFIELMAVIAIILILATIFIGSDPRPGKNLEIAAQQLANDLRLAQNMAMAAEKMGLPPDEYIPCGYGIDFNLASLSYTLVENYGGTPPDITCPGTSRVAVEEIDLPAGIEIATNSEITFSIPLGKKSPVATTTTIVLRIINDPGYLKNVIITAGGSIDIE